LFKPISEDGILEKEERRLTSLLLHRRIGDVMNMGKMVTVHSFKGGTGKTIIATNLATIYANKGKNTCILDLDLRAPSLGITFKGRAKYTINDFLDGRCEINDAILNMKEKYATKGDFYVGLANHSTEAIQKIIAKDRKWEMNTSFQ
jgi:septum site-determining protein MinD